MDVRAYSIFSILSDTAWQFSRINLRYVPELIYHNEARRGKCLSFIILCRAATASVQRLARRKTSIKQISAGTLTKFTTWPGEPLPRQEEVKEKAKKWNDFWQLGRVRICFLYLVVTFLDENCPFFAWPPFEVVVTFDLDKDRSLQPFRRTLFFVLSFYHIHFKNIFS